MLPELLFADEEEEEWGAHEDEEGVNKGSELEAALL